MWAGLWQKRAKFPDTNTAIAYEQHGFFEEAQSSYEAVSALGQFLPIAAKSDIFIV